MPQTSTKQEPPSSKASDFALPLHDGREWFLRGIPASPGIVVGTLVKYDTRLYEQSSDELCGSEEEETEKLSKALNDCADEIRSLIATLEESSSAIAPILEAQLMMLDDMGIKSQITKSISEGESASQAVAQAFNKHITILASSRDKLLRDRAHDIEHVRNRLLHALHNAVFEKNLPPNAIIVAPSLTPSDLLRFQASGLQGFIAEFGGLTSHSCIIARTLSLPAVINIKNILHAVKGGEKIIIDGFSGEVVVSPQPDTIKRFEQRIADMERRRVALGQFAELESITSDGKRIHLMTNVDSPEDIDIIRSEGADGVGLVRSEFLLLKMRSLPSEVEQANWYSHLAERAFPLPITLRAFDVGADKSLNFKIEEENPALGLRGLRLLLRRKDFFKSQIRAVLRASLHKNVRFLLPMVTSVKEFLYARTIIKECMTELELEEHFFDPFLPVGAMVETPAAAIMAEELAQAADFLSIGTNDLTQYTLAADRSNPHLKDIYDAFNPAVLRFIRMTVNAAKKHSIPVSVCGDLASHPTATELLIGLEVNELSVAPSMLLELKKKIRSTEAQAAIKVSENLLSLTTGTDVRKAIQNLDR